MYLKLCILKAKGINNAEVMITKVYQLLQALNLHSRQNPYVSQNLILF